MMQCETPEPSSHTFLEAFDNVESLTARFPSPDDLSISSSPDPSSTPAITLEGPLVPVEQATGPSSPPTKIDKYTQDTDRMTEIITTLQAQGKQIEEVENRVDFLPTDVMILQVSNCIDANEKKTSSDAT